MCLWPTVAITGPAISDLPRLETLKSPGWHDTEPSLKALKTNNLPKDIETFRLR